MNETNPEIEASLDALATLCCESLSGTADPAVDRSERLLKTLLMSGYVGKKKASFQVDLETRVKAKCRDCAMHRGGALSSMSEKLAKQFADLARWESKNPSDTSPSKAANISSATDA
ncbi:hypothetical protein Pla52o_33710 [Novipirellula galeiformis]|uniref:Uncharacterized protein n=1 Tax=Novipirellula galeiformis TaxID=2528004 RepID=A0A5C6CE67_9BACT|nr:hypothetical protein [Novipirellula galeiformis]TWU22315.1 hypothetical protein Pla52o_33710 [Novipirellula galeiformis]